ncbi:MAG: hypothetical protein NTV22_15790 [bacterium]|nr:hypothetical protein [bacterium]
MNADELRQRTKLFSIRIIRLVAALPRNFIAEVWLELREASGLMNNKQLAGLYQKAHELLAIFTAIAKTTRSRS